MSKHVGRKQRWTQEGGGRYSSDLGTVLYQKGAWFALLDYRIVVLPDSGRELLAWENRNQRLGPFKRPRNAMVALEREVSFLRNRHGENVVIGLAR